LPYYQTVGTRYGGKSTPEQIRNFILGKTTDPSKFQSVADDPENRHKVGVDCSGLVAYVLNEATEERFTKPTGKPVMQMELVRQPSQTLNLDRK